MRFIAIIGLHQIVINLYKPRTSENKIFQKFDFRMAYLLGFTGLTSNLQFEFVKYIQKRSIKCLIFGKKERKNAK
jgi:hypothetical protein